MENSSKAVPSRLLRIFLCHASSDKQVVRELYKRLRACNVAPWLDEENLIPGQDFEFEIRKAVRETDVVIVCLSRQSITKSGFVQKEIKFALDVADEQPEGTIFIIPVRLEECNVPERLSRWHWVNYFERKGFDKLMNALKERGMSLSGQINPIDCQPNSDFVPTPPALRSNVTSNQTNTSGQIFSPPPYRNRTNSMNRKNVFIFVLAVVLVVALIGSIFLHNNVYQFLNMPTATASASRQSSPSPTPSVKILYKADWSKGLGDWKGGSEWSVEHGLLINNGSNQNIEDTNKTSILAPFQPQTANYTVEAQIQFLGEVYSSNSFALFGIFVRGGSRLNDVGYFCYFNYDDNSARIKIAPITHASKTQTLPAPLGRTLHTFRVVAKNNGISFFIDNTSNPIAELTDNNFSDPGVVGLFVINSKITVSRFEVLSV